jgi:hypothetical protein
MNKMNLAAAAAIAVKTFSVAPAMAQQHRVVFEKPIQVSVPSVPTLVQTVDMKLSSQSGWRNVGADSTLRQCSVTLSVHGRDIALQNSAIGEHYFGTMDLGCSGGFWRKSFRMHYSRVLFLGIRNCVQSDTMVDQDYCKLQVVAFQREGDMSAERGDYLINTPTRKRFYAALEPTGWQYVEKQKLLPEGMNPATLNAVQVFDLSLSRNGRELLIVNPGKESSFLTGSNYYFGGGDAVASRDEVLVRDVSSQLDGVEKVLGTIRGEGAMIEPTSMQAFLAGLSSATTRMLGVFSPAEYFRLEKRVRELEADLIAQVQASDPQIVDRETFVQKYGTSFQEYLRIAAYLKGSRRGTDLAGRTGEFPRPDLNPATDIEVGKTFTGETFEGGTRNAHRLALRQCHDYLGKSEFAPVRQMYSCGAVKQWETSYAYYATVKVVRVE